jgi:putative oxidoreductase
MPSLNRFSPHTLGALRVVAGLLFLGHGLIKVVGFPAGAYPGPQDLTSLFGVAGLLEIALGALIALGLFTRAAAFVASGEMAVGYFMIHAPKSFFPAVNQGEPAVLFAFIFLLLAATGPGAFAIDAYARPAARPEPARA